MRLSYSLPMPKSTMLNVRLPVEIRDALKQAAAAEQRNMSNLTLVILSRWLSKHGFLAAAKPATPARAKKGE